MISFGAVIGRTTPSQLVVMTFLEVSTVDLSSSPLPVRRCTAVVTRVPSVVTPHGPANTAVVAVSK